MATIICVKEARDKGYVSVGVKDGDDVCYYTVSKIEYSELGSPTRHEQIDEDTVSLLCASDERFRARKKALSILSYADNSERMLALKLSRQGFSQGAVLGAVKECVMLGYVDEMRQLTRLIPLLAAKLHGPRYIKHALMKKGYSSSDISSCIDTLVFSGEIDFKENLSRLFERYQPSDDEERRALARKYGY